MGNSSDVVFFLIFTAACRRFESRMEYFFPDGKAPDRIPVPPDSDSESDGEGDGDSDDDSDSGERFTEPDDGPYGFDAFLSAASLVASRAFQVDSTSGQGLVPIADLFNHRGGFAGGEHVHFTSGEGDDEDADSDSNGDRSDSEEETVPGTNWPRRPNDVWDRPTEPMPGECLF